MPIVYNTDFFFLPSLTAALQYLYPVITTTRARIREHTFAQTETRNHSTVVIAPTITLAMPSSRSQTCIASTNIVRCLSQIKAAPFFLRSIPLQSTPHERTRHSIIVPRGAYPRRQHHRPTFSVDQKLKIERNQAFRIFYKTHHTTQRDSNPTPCSVYHRCRHRGPALPIEPREFDNHFQLQTIPPRTVQRRYRHCPSVFSNLAFSLILLLTQ